MRKKVIFASALAFALALTGCSSSSKDSAAGTDKSITITLWHNLGDTQNATATKALTDAYTVLHPNVTFNLVSQPADYYFALLQAAAFSKSGPDLALMWTGLFVLNIRVTSLTSRVSSQTQLLHVKVRSNGPQITLMLQVAHT